MTSVKISMRGLAEVASAKPSSKHSKLKQYQFPDSEESKGRSNYYVKALSAIKRHHRGKEDFAGGVNSTLLHVLYEAAIKQGLPIKPNGVECLQTSSGSRTTGPRRGFPDKKVLNAACQELLSLWLAA
jgi:hypothetical protein